MTIESVGGLEAPSLSIWAFELSKDVMSMIEKSNVSRVEMTKASLELSERENVRTMEFF